MSKELGSDTFDYKGHISSYASAPCHHCWEVDMAQYAYRFDIKKPYDSWPLSQ